MKPVNPMMNRFGAVTALALLAGVAVIAGYGCTPKAENKKPDATQGTKPATGGSGGILDPDGDGKGPVTPDDIKVDPVPAPKPTENGYQPTKEVTAVALAAKMDKAMRDLKNAMGRVQLNYVWRGDQLTGSANLKFDSPGKYRVEYYIPETTTQRHLIVADGKERAMLTGDGWKKLGKAREAKPAPSYDEVDLQAWSDDFMQDMLSTYRTGEDAWKPVVEAWANGKDGYKLSTEKRFQKVQGRDGKTINRPYYRLVATPKTAAEPHIEVIVDGEHYLPLTIKSVSNDPKVDKKLRDRIIWTCQWGFGGKHDASDFVIPKA